MTINGKRRFNFNGKKYYIQNTSKRDVQNGKGKYYISVWNNEHWDIAYNVAGWFINYFDTIKEAQWFVRDWDFMLDVM